MKNKKISLGTGINSVEGESWVFNKNVETLFDKHVRQSIPFYDPIQKYISSLSEWFIKDNSLVYDLGCSTGNLLKLIESKIPAAQIYGYDMSSSAIEECKKTFNTKCVNVII